MRRAEAKEAERPTPEMWRRVFRGRYRDKPRRRSVERREAQAPTSLGSRIPGGGPRWARPSCAGRLLRKESAKGVSQTPKGPRKPLAPPGAPSPRFGGERKKGMGVPGACKLRIRAAERWLFLSS